MADKLLMALTTHNYSKYWNKRKAIVLLTASWMFVVMAIFCVLTLVYFLCTWGESKQWAQTTFHHIMLTFNVGNLRFDSIVI